MNPDAPRERPGGRVPLVSEKVGALPRPVVVNRWT
jgi:hypothetical protein